MKKETCYKFILFAHGAGSFFSWHNCLFAFWTPFLCHWLPHIVRPDTPSSPFISVVKKNLHRAKPTVETCWFNFGVVQLFSVASLSHQVFHDALIVDEGIVGDGNRNLYVKGGICRDSEVKINWIKCSLMIYCWEYIFSWKSCCEGCLQVYPLKDCKGSSPVYFSCLSSPEYWKQQ